MVASYPRHRFSLDDYVDFLEQNEGKFEYFEGEIYAMGGGTYAHAVLGAEVVVQLHRQLAGTKCRVCSSDLVVRAKATGLVTLADATVVCGPVEIDPEDTKGLTVVTNPTVVVEVTSPTSETRDRGSKLAHYKTIPSLRAVVVVVQSERLVEVHTRESEGWGMRSASSGLIEITQSPALTLDVDALHAAVEAS